MSLSHLEFTELLNVYINAFCRIWIVFSQYVLAYFVCSFLCHLSFWYFHYVHVVHLMMSHISLRLFHFSSPLPLPPSFCCCSDSKISIDVSLSLDVCMACRLLSQFRQLIILPHIQPGSSSLEVLCSAIPIGTQSSRPLGVGVI